jgi:hypothetical protein
MYILSPDYADWDTIIHEYGHAVQQINNFFPFNDLTTAISLLSEGHAAEHAP